MSEPYLAEVRMVGFNFPPRGYAQCDGQILPINQNQSLYALLGTIYGGDGRTTFALPDLRGRIPFHPGSSMNIGAKGGGEQHSLTVQEMPPHTHTMQCVDSAGSSATPETNLPAESVLGDLQYSTVSQPAYGGSNGGATASNGGGQAHDNMPPYQVLNFVIALTGVFPSRN